MLWGVIRMATERQVLKAADCVQQVYGVTALRASRSRLWLRAISSGNQMLSPKCLR